MAAVACSSSSSSTRDQQKEITESASETLTSTISTGNEARLACRNKSLTTVTSGLAPGYLQANLIILPSRYASDFRLLCARNPVPCPLIAESSAPGAYDQLRSYIPGSAVAADLDLRHDAPRYMVYRDARVARSHVLDVAAEWTPDHVAFLVGCSYSFESALAAHALPPRHAVLGRNVAMYRTAVPLCPAGVFTGGTYVVSMRPYPLRDVDRVREITRAYNATHGEPLDWGWDTLARLGIASIDEVQWGDAPLAADGETPLGALFGSEDEVPVFWGCGVTPQEAVVKAGDKIQGTVMAHAPGHMLLLDSRDEDVVKSSYD
ncbi:hypothetical protein PFICI_11379 [Pestalotiopsis fici W106-1]|uniref:DUF1445 domain-containing protein n=1 Tax=Pestalotiopsis fici (strain W106-1 / CGMCC3.15140) TaxID=1229662 RepID=W3WUI1_PESFW|nr:uncharacterized protein PFICI_11379 [Pestalotiopsis fici W106-1]ETS77505.1 hypothetical protein PFICI_11379 [Pestalotiopsis fici W106-1]